MVKLECKSDKKFYDTVICIKEQTYLNNAQEYDDTSSSEMKVREEILSYTYVHEKTNRSQQLIRIRLCW